MSSIELNEFRDELIDWLDKSRDYDDVSFYVGEMLRLQRPTHYATDEQIQQKIRGAIRNCSNLNLKRGYKGAAKDLADFIWSIVKEKN